MLSKLTFYSLKSSAIYCSLCQRVSCGRPLLFAPHRPASSARQTPNANRMRRSETARGRAARERERERDGAAAAKAQRPPEGDGVGAGARDGDGRTRSVLLNYLAPTALSRRSPPPRAARSARVCKRHLSGCRYRSTRERLSN
ncbi:hypothetical protein EVAR_47394_1 [Eumeta japonica]|uniref:Uncharacterized protein n=1 Tax=Eumeta variegata TaxID=151549 RepID=A0A4C1WTB3_EUMVA|nr:hypothetical protein EVAR_47394_1 [Eumeta japonica]